jgi:hypothetical protein
VRRCAGGWALAGWIGELGQGGFEEPGAQVGDKHRLVDAGLGEPVAVGCRDAADEAVSPQPAQVVADLAGADLVRVLYIS